MRLTNKFTRTAAVLAMGAALGAAPVQAEEGNYVLATASTGGTYYPVGVALATLIKVKLQPTENIAMSAISSAGSGENVRLLREGEAQFGILQGLYGYFARTGSGPLEESGPQEELRSVSMLWQNVEQFIVAKEYAKTGNASDLKEMKGESFGFGAQNSGSVGSSAAILEGFGIDIETDYNLIYGGYGPAAEALQNGQAQGINTPAGIPTGAVSQLYASDADGIKMLNFTDEEIAEADGGRDLWTKFVIPAGTYPGLDEDVTTIAQPNFLATTADLPEENVYMITKAIYENLPFLQAIHPATKAMALEKAIAGLPVPLHPGALKYYQEVGVEVPDRLIAK